jgi:hypothetical protein
MDHYGTEPPWWPQETEDEFDTDEWVCPVSLGLLEHLAKWENQSSAMYVFLLLMAHEEYIKWAKQKMRPPLGVGVVSIPWDDLARRTNVSSERAARAHFNEDLLDKYVYLRPKSKGRPIPSFKVRRFKTWEHFNVIGNNGKKPSKKKKEKAMEDGGTPLFQPSQKIEDLFVDVIVRHWAGSADEAGRAVISEKARDYMRTHFSNYAERYSGVDMEGAIVAWDAFIRRHKTKMKCTVPNFFWEMNFNKHMEYMKKQGEARGKDESRENKSASYVEQWKSKFGN